MTKKDEVHKLKTEKTQNADQFLSMLSDTSPEKKTKPVLKTIRLEKLHSFENHPYKVQDDAAMEELKQSMKEAGLLNRIIVRPMEGKEDEYEIISGHRRVYAAKQLGMKELPAVVHTVERDEATLMMVNSNCQREALLPSEKAFAYKMKLDAIKHQGKASRQNVGRSESADTVSDTESGRTVQRYIRLTHLIPELLELTDKGRIALTVACELSYLPRNMQSYVLGEYEEHERTPSYAQSCKMHKLSDAGELDYDAIHELMAQEKPNQREAIKIAYAKLKGRIPDSYSDKQAEAFILRALDYYCRHLNKQREAER